MKRIVHALLSAFFVVLTIAPASSANRIIYQYGQVLSAQFLNQEQRFTRLGLGQLAADIFGTNGGYSNLTIAPTSGMYVVVQPSTTNGQGALYQMGPDDASTYGGNSVFALAADPTTIMDQALLNTATAPIGPLPAPTLSGQTLDVLIECNVQDVDTDSQSFNFLFNGLPSSQTLPRDRDELLSCLNKNGTASTTPSIPAPDLGYTEIGYVAIPYGTNALTSSMVTQFPTIQPTLNFLPNQLDPTSIAQGTVGGTVPITFPNGITIGALALRNTGMTMGSSTFNSTTVASGSSVIAYNGSTTASIGLGVAGTVAYPVVNNASDGGMNFVIPSSSTLGYRWFKNNGGTLTATFVLDNYGNWSSLGSGNIDGNLGIAGFLTAEGHNVPYSSEDASAPTTNIVHSNGGSENSGAGVSAGATYTANLPPPYFTNASSFGCGTTETSVAGSNPTTGHVYIQSYGTNGSGQVTSITFMNNTNATIGISFLCEGY